MSATRRHQHPDGDRVNREEQMAVGRGPGALHTGKAGQRSRPRLAVCGAGEVWPVTGITTMHAYSSHVVTSKTAHLPRRQARRQGGRPMTRRARHAQHDQCATRQTADEVQVEIRRALRLLLDGHHVPAQTSEEHDQYCQQPVQNDGRQAIAPERRTYGFAGQGVRLRMPTSIQLYPGAVADRCRTVTQVRPSAPKRYADTDLGR